MWDGVNAGQSAQSIELDGSMLTAELPMRDGGYRERQGIDLNDRISNENGHLVYQCKTSLLLTRIWLTFLSS
jgi:hypothetical protein